MFDLGQLGLPTEITAHGARWMAIHRLGNAPDGAAQYIAVKADDDGKFRVPAPCFVVQTEPAAKDPSK